MKILLLLALSGMLNLSFTADDEKAVNGAGQEVKTSPLRLTVGEDKIVDLSFKANSTDDGITIGNNKVVKTTLVKIGDDHQIVFKPLAEGNTTVTVRDEDGFVRTVFDIDVIASDLEKIVRELNDLLKDVEGIEIRIVGKTIVIDGEVIVPADYGRIINVLDGKNSPYSEMVLNLTGLSPVALQVLSKRIQKDINTFAPNVTSRIVNGQIWLEGSVDSVEKGKRAGLIARLYIPEVKPTEAIEKDPSAKRIPPRPLVQNFIIVTPPPKKRQDKLVRITSHFVELAKDYSNLFGFKWEPGFTSNPQITIGGEGATAGGTGAGATFTATLSNLFPKLQSAQKAGYARILKTGTVVVRSGQPGTLKDTTSIPFAVIDANGNAASSSAAVGTSIAVTPLVLNQGNDIQLDLDLSQVNLTGFSNSQPITSEHQVKTKIYVQSTESAAIGGMTSTDITTSFNKDDPSPGNFSSGQNPTTPLFSLLRSKNYTKKKYNFVIFVTPEVILSASEGTQDLKKNFRVTVK